MNNYCQPCAQQTMNYPGLSNGAQVSAPPICIPLPTEEFGVVSSICVQSDLKTMSLRIYLQIYGAEVELGVLDVNRTNITVDLGAIIKGYGWSEEGLGMTLGVKLNTVSGCISVCIKAYHFNDVSGLWSSIITCI